MTHIIKSILAIGDLVHALTADRYKDWIAWGTNINPRAEDIQDKLVNDINAITEKIFHHEYLLTTEQ
jgi:hypothetical protein